MENYRRRITLVLLLAGTLSVLIGGATWLALTSWSSLDVSTISALAAITIMAVFGLAAILLGRHLAQPLTQIAAALEHVNPETTGLKPPRVDDLVKPFAEQVYKLASSAQKLTTDIESQRSFLDAAISTMPVGVFCFTSDSKLVYANPAGAKLLGQPAEDLVGLERPKVLDWFFQSDEDYDVWLERTRNKSVHKNRFWERVAIHRTDNKRIIGDLAVHYEKGGKHDIETVVVFIDRTKQYVADEAQLDFVAVAAHELRGPITVIRGYLDVLMEEIGSGLTVDEQVLLQKLTVSAEMLSLYVNNILNVARIEQQDMTLHIVEADWLDVIKTAYTDLFLRTKAHGRVLKLDIPKELPSVGVDRVTITEVINNLVDNAIKYSYEGGEININVKLEEGFIQTTIEDHGIGIPDSLVGNLFKKFYRSHRTKTGVSGTGLGLYLCKAILDAHGGNIWVRSKEGEGSIFGFELPTYDSIAQSIKDGNKDGHGIKRTSHGWIKNHSMYRR